MKHRTNDAERLQSGAPRQPWLRFASSLALLILLPWAAAYCQAPTSPVIGDGSGVPQSPAPTNNATANVDSNWGLSVEQARLADRFKRLEEVIGRLAELSASTDPRRAKLLRDAIAQSREQDINVRFESVVKLLEEERLSAATTNQSELQKELDGLLTLLLKADRDRELTSQRERVRKYLKEVARLIRLQKGIRARTEGDDELKTLSDDQLRVAGDTGKLGGDIHENESEKKEESDPEDGETEQGIDRPEDEEANDDADDGKKSKKSDGKPNKSEEKRKSADANPSDGKSEDSKSNKAKPGEPKASEANPSNSKPAQPKEGESAPQRPGESKPSDSKPNDGKPSDGKPSESGEQQQSDSPSEGDQPNEGQSQSPAQQQEQRKPPAERASERLRDAQKKMEDAQKKLEDSERKGAAEQQREALKDLEQAKAELERVLRQLREEELERTLAQLTARFRKMLQLQIEVHEGTVQLDQVPVAERDHDDEIEAARLSRSETQIVSEADRALLLLHEEGSSVAFPEAVEQMRSDMRQIAKRLGEVKVDAITQGLEEDVIAALEETIATLDKAIKDLEKKKTPPGQQRPAGEPAEPPLVDKLAELKMIRSLQMRINLRTQRYGKMIEGEQAETEDLLEALQDLSERQQRVYRATADLNQSRND
jgi:hypothetical protein